MARGVNRTARAERAARRAAKESNAETAKKNTCPGPGLSSAESKVLNNTLNFMRSHVTPDAVPFSEVKDHWRIKNLDHLIKKKEEFLRRFPKHFELDLVHGCVKLKGKPARKRVLPQEPAQKPDIVSPTSIRRSNLNNRLSYVSSVFHRLSYGSAVSLVVKRNEVENALERLSGFSLLSMDCEGVHLNGVRDLTLLQLASREHVFLFDFLSMDDPDLTYAIDKLRPLLEDKAISKIFHDCRQDSAALWNQYKIKLTNVFDTQATYVSMKSQRNKTISEHLPALQVLLQIYGSKDWFEDVKHVPQMMVDNPMLWRYRPLTEELVTYAAISAECLFTVREGLLEDMMKLVSKACISEGDRNASAFRSMTGETRMLDRAMAFNLRNELVSEVDIPEHERGDIVRTPLEIEEDLRSFIRLLPNSLAAHPVFYDPQVCHQLREILLDIGRDPLARFHSGKHLILYKTVTREDIDSSVRKLGRFGTDNRAGVEGALHRISAICNRSNEVIGLTFRLGRAVRGCADIIRDVVRCHTGGGILLLGSPGTGKTTIIRDIARVLSEEKNVVIIDTSNEIGGDGDIPHPAIGRARRMQVRRLDEQEDRMIECVQNHTPDVIIVDEIGRAREAHAARTISKRGVRLVASAHGSFAELVQNPVLSELLGGVEIVTVGDTAAKKLYDGNKHVQQRKRGSIFQTVIELNKENMHSWSIFRNVETVVDRILQGQPFRAEVRSINPVTGQLMSRDEVRTVPLKGPISFLERLQG